MSIYVRNLTINTHSDFIEELELFQTGGERTNLTGYTAQSQMRKHPDSSTAYDFFVIIMDAENGKLTLLLDETATVAIKPGRYMYDLMLTRPNGEKTIVVEGMVNVRSGISTNCF